MANGMNRRVSYEEAQASPHNRINSYSHNDQQKQEKLQISPHFSLDDMIEAKQEAAQRQAEAQAEEMDKELEAYLQQHDVIDVQAYHETTASWELSEPSQAGNTQLGQDRATINTDNAVDGNSAASGLSTGISTDAGAGFGMDAGDCGGVEQFMLEYRKEMHYMIYRITNREAMSIAKQNAVVLERIEKYEKR